MKTAPQLWMLRTAFRTQGRGHRAFLRGQEVVRRTVEFLPAGIAG